MFARTLVVGLVAVLLISTATATSFPQSTHLTYLPFYMSHQHTRMTISRSYMLNPDFVYLVGGACIGFWVYFFCLQKNKHGPDPQQPSNPSFIASAPSLTMPSMCICCLLELYRNGYFAGRSGDIVVEPASLKVRSRACCVLLYVRAKYVHFDFVCV
jgi:hypothetical protein